MGLRAYLDTLRPRVVNFSQAERDKLILNSTLFGLGLGLGTDLISQAAKIGLLAPGSLFWLKVAEYPVETLIVTTTLSLCTATTLAIVAKDCSDGTPLPPRRR